MNRLERLVNLMAALLASGRPLIRAEIRERVPGYPNDDGAFRRSFERDKESLRQMGVPVVLEPLDKRYPEAGEGYRIPKDQYELPDPGLDSDELAALHLAASTVQLQGNVALEALWKLGGASASHTSTTRASLSPSEHLTELFAAVASRRTVRFEYKGEQRELDPYRLAFRNGHWYVAGFDHKRQEQRSFRLDRFGSSPETTGEQFTNKVMVAYRTLTPWQMGDEEPVDVQLLVDEEQAGWVGKELGPDTKSEPAAGGGVIFTVRVTNQSAFRSFVLGLLTHAEVVAPPSVRSDIVSWLESMFVSTP